MAEGTFYHISLEFSAIEKIFQICARYVNHTVQHMYMRSTSKTTFRRDEVAFSYLFMIVAADQTSKSTVPFSRHFLTANSRFSDLAFNVSQQTRTKRERKPRGMTTPMICKSKSRKTAIIKTAIAIEIEGTIVTMSPDLANVPASVKDKTDGILDCYILCDKEAN